MPNKKKPRPTETFKNPLYVAPSINRVTTCNCAGPSMLSVADAAEPAPNAAVPVYNAAVPRYLVEMLEAMQIPRHDVEEEFGILDILSPYMDRIRYHGPHDPNANLDWTESALGGGYSCSWGLLLPQEVNGDGADAADAEQKEEQSKEEEHEEFIVVMEDKCTQTEDPYDDRDYCLYDENESEPPEPREITTATRVRKVIKNVVDGQN